MPIYGDYTSTNNPIGWLYMYVSHLINNCGMRDHSVPEVVAYACNQSQQACIYHWLTQHENYSKDTREGLRDVPEFSGMHLSDNQCVMSTARYFYSMCTTHAWVEGRKLTTGIFITCCNERFNECWRFDVDALEYWKDRA